MSTDQGVPDITVELEDRRSILLESVLGGGAAGLVLVGIVSAGGVTMTAVGFPTPLDGTTAATLLAFHLLFATVFGSIFGLLVDSRPVWMYGRGFLGPVVGTAYGGLLWVATGVVFWPLVLGVLDLPLGLSAGAPVGVALGSHLAYGALVGVLLNLFALART